MLQHYLFPPSSTVPVLDLNDIPSFANETDPAVSRLDEEGA